MSQETKPYRTNVHLTFPPTISGAPLVCNLTRLFDLDFNISTAQITPRQEGFLTLELSGSRDACDKGIGYLREILTECKTFSQIKAALILRSSNSGLPTADPPCGYTAPDRKSVV